MLVSIEGIDGSGKGTLASALVDALEKSGSAASLMSFPQYGMNPFADEIGRYLNHGLDLHGNDAVRYAAMLYASDRAAARGLIEQRLADGEIVVCDRYVESNLAHQVARVPVEQSVALRDWIVEIEYWGFKMPRPELTFLLDLDVSTARRRVRDKKRRQYTELLEDAHESDTAYLERTRSQYLALASEDPFRWSVVDVVGGGLQMSPAAVLDSCLAKLRSQIVKRGN